MELYTRRRRPPLRPLAPLLACSPEPLRVGRPVLTQVLTAVALGQPTAPAWAQRLQAMAGRSRHPLVRVRVRVARVAHAWLAPQMMQPQPQPPAPPPPWRRARAVSDC